MKNNQIQVITWIQIGETFAEHQRDFVGSLAY